MSSPYYSQFISGHLWGDGFVLSSDSGLTIQFFYDESGNITIREYDSYKIFNNSIPGGDPDGLIRQIQYNINTDVLSSYTWTDPDLNFDNIVTLSDGDEDIRYSNLNDYIVAGGGNDLIYTVGGHDVLYGGLGNDELSGSTEQDVTFGNDGNDKIFSGSDTDFIFGGAGADFLDGDPGNDVVSGGAGNDELNGGSDQDIIIDLAGDNIISGNQGDDYIIAGDGKDTIYGNDGSDIIHAGGGDDRVNGGTTGDDILYGDAGNDRLYTQQGADVVYGGDGDDYISGSTFGNDGNDIFYGQGGSDEIKGRGGNDRLFADDPGGVAGDPGNDKLRGGDGEDLLVGGDGRDLLFGENGNDLLVGSPEGQSVMFGGAGSDTFAFLDMPDGKAHRIEDFTFGEDIINVSDVLDGYDPAADDINDFVRIFFRDTTRTDIKINADGAGDDWEPLAVVLSDFTGTSPGIMIGTGDLVANNNLFDSDW